MPRVHVETARLQLRGCLGLIADDVEDLLEPGAERAPRCWPSLASWPGAALLEHDAWLADRDRRLRSATPGSASGPTPRELWYALDTEIDPDALLTRAESDLMALEEEIS